MSLTQNLFFVGVGRLGDDLRAVVIGGYSYNTDTDIGGVKKVLEQPSLDMTPGKHYSFTIQEVSWHLIQDENCLIYIMITSSYYPQRVAFTCLNDLQKQFTAKINSEEAILASEKAYNRSCSSLFSSICQKYDNLQEIDKLSAVTRKVDTIKVVMQENVSLALANCVKLESIEQATEDLQQQAGVFRKNATELKNKMWWKNVKLWIIIGVITVVILVIVISIAASQAKAAQSIVEKKTGIQFSSPVSPPTPSPSHVPTPYPSISPTILPTHVPTIVPT